MAKSKSPPSCLSKMFRAIAFVLSTTAVVDGSQSPWIKLFAPSPVHTTERPEGPITSTPAKEPLIPTISVHTAAPEIPDHRNVLSVNSKRSSSNHASSFEKSGPSPKRYIKFGEFPPVEVDDNMLQDLSIENEHVASGRLATTANPDDNETKPSQSASNWDQAIKALVSISNEVSKFDHISFVYPLADTTASDSKQASRFGDIQIERRLFHSEIRGYPMTMVEGVITSLGKTVKLKYTDINSDFRLRNEFVILRYLQAHGVAPRPLLLSSPGGGYIMQARFLVTEPDGEPLYSYAGSMPTQGLLTICLKAIDALETIHSQGIVHGDLSELTVHYIQSTDQVVLTDFHHASFYPDVESYPLDDPLLVISSALDYGPPIDHQTPYEIARIFPYTRRDDLYRWVEMMARVISGNEHSARLHTETGYEPLAEMNFKLQDRFFILKGTGMSTVWGRYSSKTRNRLHVLFKAILTHIRSLDIDDTPDYSFIRTNLLGVIRVLSTN